MGYTHYWYTEKDKEIEEKVWTNFTNDAKSLIVGSPILEKAREEYKSDWFGPT